MHYRHPGFLKTFGSRLGAGLADELLDRWFPPAPSFLQRFAAALAEQAPMIVELVNRLYPPNREQSSKKHITGSGSPVPFDGGGVAWAPGCKSLGEFTCPKCAGHTWTTMGFDENGTYLRYCTNGALTQYPECNPNTVKEPCDFQWKATEDHLYFAKPSADDVRRATETQVRVDDRIDQIQMVIRAVVSAVAAFTARGDRRPEGAARTSLGDAGKRLGIKSARERVGLPPTSDADKRYRSPIQIAVGERVGPGETTEEAAARLLTEADEFIRAQAKKIDDLVLDNVFPPGKGEVGFMLSEATAKKIGLAYQPGAKPIRVSLVLDGWQWAVRLGLGRVGGELIRVDWDVAMEIMRGAKDAAASAQQEMVAQNAAGGVA